jgi:hypothetical protein
MEQTPTHDDHDPSVRDVHAHADIGLDADGQQRTVAHVRRAIDQATSSPTVEATPRHSRLRTVGRWTPALVGAAVIAVIAVAAIDGPSAPKSEVKQVGEGIPEGPPSRSFALLREPSKVEMPDEVQRLLSNVGAPVSSAKSIDLGFDRPGWALSSAERVCIVVPDTLRGKFAGYGSSCTTREHAQTSGVSDTRRHADEPGRSDPQEVYALIPDGVGSVTVASQDGQTRTVDVERNVLRVSGQVADTITFKDADGRQRNLLAADTLPAN